MKAVVTMALILCGCGSGYYPITGSYLLTADPVELGPATCLPLATRTESRLCLSVKDDGSFLARLDRWNVSFPVSPGEDGSFVSSSGDARLMGTVGGGVFSANLSIGVDPSSKPGYYRCFSDWYLEGPRVSDDCR